ncbi:MAG: hypothetical protein NC489_44205, partial [Ruminococcus flavefaciens]|nr:hypothetical protein [Ruminococcus flavefaciens]
LFICAALVCCAFVLPKNMKSANAAAVSVTPTISYGSLLYFANTDYNASVSEADMSTTPLSYVSSIVSGNTITTTIEAKSGYSDYKQNTIVASRVEMSATVPAHTVYTINYTVDHQLTGKYGRQHGLMDGWSTNPNAGFYFDNSSPGHKFGDSQRTNTVNGTSDKGNTGPHPGGHLVSLYNDTDNSKTVSVYTYYVFHIGDGGPSQTSYTSSVNFDSFTVTAANIKAPSESGDKTQDYDGNAKTFNFTYDTPDIEDYDGNITYSTAYKNIETTVMVEDFEGNQLDAGTYDGTAATSTKYSLTAMNSSGQTTLKATDAGIYKVKFILKSGAVSGGVAWDDGSTNPVTLTFTIKRKPLTVPTVQNASSYTYNAGTQKLGVSDFNPTYMEVDASTLNSDVPGVLPVWNSSNEEFEVINAANYTVEFKLTDGNYEWSDGTILNQSVSFSIKRKEIAITPNPAAESDREWDFGTAGSFEIVADATGIPAADQDYVLNIYYIKDGETSPVNLGVTGTALDVSQVPGSGNYKLYVGLTSAAANNNYTVSSAGTNGMAFKINAGAIDFSPIVWQYTTKADGSGKQNLAGADLRYKVDGSDLVKYYVSAYISSSPYLTIDNSYNGGSYQNGFWTTNKDGSNVTYGDAIGKYKTRVALKTDADHKFTDAASYGILDGNDLTGWYEFEWEIKKGVIDQNYIDNISKYLLYKIGETSYPYDPGNPPGFGSGTIKIVADDSKFPDGVTGVTLSGQNDKSQQGTYNLTANFTVDTDHYEQPMQKQFQWSIAAKAIEVDWTAEEWAIGGVTVLDGENVPYMVPVLNIADNLKQYIDYIYYYADPGDPLDFSKATELGRNDTGLNKLKNDYGASSTSSVSAFVMAVLKTGVTQYVLKDNTGATDPCVKFFEMGASNTLVRASLGATEMVYGENIFNSSLLTMIVDDGTNATLDPQFIDNIKVYAPNGDDLGLLSAFDGTTAEVGEYTIRIKLTAQGDNTYTLSPSSFKFKVTPKKIALPTVDEIIFGNIFVDLAEHLHGTYDDYKDIITLNGDINGVKFVGTYNATLTINNPNYCWNYDSLTPAKTVAKLVLSDLGFSKDTETVANLEWSINPYVLKTSNWNLKGKEGALYNIP